MGDDNLARALALDWRSAALEPANRAMLEYAARLTEDPHGVTAKDVDRLREAGFDDTAVLDICQVTSYYNYVNRLAEGLGVELEETWTEEELVIDRAEFEGRGTSGGPP